MFLSRHLLDSCCAIFTYLSSHLHILPCFQLFTNVVACCFEYSYVQYIIIFQLNFNTLVQGLVFIVALDFNCDRIWCIIRVMRITCYPFVVLYHSSLLGLDNANNNVYYFFIWYTNKTFCMIPDQNHCGGFLCYLLTIILIKLLHPNYCNREKSDIFKYGIIFLRIDQFKHFPLQTLRRLCILFYMRTLQLMFGIKMPKRL